ncbi:MAG: transcription elongation factor GreA [Candidatus Peregrinibacteria bacterium Greene0416_62]|nr:MAG: transcription elongation factor GreA [Candidatus Peregrinibacteria bacterium Greene0416_62]TSD00137.1 MAG: transcription elongation factor GreA [Candidatus Peregrinibacteria bacterium Greene1014_49]
MPNDDDLLTDDELPEERVKDKDEDSESGDPEKDILSPGGSSATGDDDQTLVTKEGLKKLKEELEYLKTVRRKEMAQRLKEAISYGDLSENSEYEEAKNEQAFVEGRILELEQKIKNAKIISEKKVDTKRDKDIDIGTTVTVRNRSEGEDPETYIIVGSTEADPLEHKISNESPIGRALLGKRKGDIVEVPTPAGKFKYEVLKVA